LGFVIIKELFQPSHIASFLENNFFIFCGKISFSVYLFHLSAIHYAQQSSFGLALYYFSFIYSICQGALIHFAIERPLMNYTRRMGISLEHSKVLQPWYRFLSGGLVTSKEA
jgi:peptidoglycan/LPS O-acetylase OafA/YrhL